MTQIQPMQQQRQDGWTFNFQDKRMSDNDKIEEGLALGSGRSSSPLEEIGPTFQSYNATLEATDVCRCRCFSRCIFGRKVDSRFGMKFEGSAEL